METTEQGQPIYFNMETDSNINTITNTEGTPEEIKQVKKSRGRPKKTEQETAQTQKATKPKTTKEQQRETNIYYEQQQILNIQSKLNELKQTEQEHKEALTQFKEAEQKRDKTLKQFKEADQEYNKELKQFKPTKPKGKATGDAEQQL